MPVQDRMNKLLAALNKSPDEWHSRKEVAEAIGTAVLSPSDSVLLEVMAGQNLIEMRESHGRTNLSRWEYRVKGATMKDIQYKFAYAIKGAADEYDVQLADDGTYPDYYRYWVEDLPNTHGERVTITIYCQEAYLPDDVKEQITNRAKSLVSRELFGPK